MDNLFPIIILAAIFYFVVKTIWAAAAAPDMICMDCGNIGDGEYLTRGNLLIEIILWLCFIVPGLIYSIWRLSSSEKRCAICHGKLIRLDSPRGRQLKKQSILLDH